MRPDENILLDHHRALVLHAHRTPVEVRKDRCPKTDCAVVSDENAIGMAIIQINEVREPDMLADLHSA